MADVSKIKLPDGTTYNIKDTVSGYVTADTAPVTSVNEQIGNVTITEGLEPLIGTINTVTPQQVMTALGEGRDICITASTSLLPDDIPLSLKFTSFNRATDTVYSGQALDIVASQTIAVYNGVLYLFELVGGTFSMEPYPWEVIQTGLATVSNLNVAISDVLENFSNYVPTVREVNGKALSADITITASDVGAVPATRKVNNKTLSSDIMLDADDVGALPDSTIIPSKTSDLTNDSGFITGYTETDPTVPSWAKASTKPTYTADEVGAIRGNVGGVFYGTCSTAAGTAAKVVGCADFTADNLKAGTIIVVSFSATNSGAVASLTLNVNSTGAKPIKYINNGTLGNLTSAGYLKANVEYPFYYDGTNWVVWFNYNTTYSALSEADMHTGTATTARTITAQRLKQAVEYHAPVTSVNGNTGDVTISVPTKTSDLTNDGNGSSSFVTYNSMANEGYITADDLATPTFRAADATSKAVLRQAIGADANIKTPSSYTSQLSLLYDLEPRTWFCWMNGTEMEFARMSISVNTGTSAITLYLRGRASIATGIMGVDSSWTVTPLASDAEGVAY